uniref:Riboflavin transporter n=1 Tax=Syphacia muris TaxID=451379 RepID=A0A0N5AQA6_9BILA
MVRVITYVLVVLFGSSSWLSTNAIWMQLPYLTEQLPEGWSLPSYLAAVVQIACIGPLIYSIIHKCTAYSFQTAPLILLLLVFCCICTALLAIFWSGTLFIFGSERSVYLILLLFGMALVNSTSNVLFMPYMSAYHVSYLTAYFVGMGVSSLFPSMVSLLQGSGDGCVFINGSYIKQYIPPRFDVSEYNFVMLFWMIIATISFALLHWSPLGKEGSAKKVNKDMKVDLPVDESSPLNRYADMSVEDESADKISPCQFRFLMFLTAVVNAQMNGIIPSIQSYAALPYSQATYHFALTLSHIVSPLICFLPLVVQPRRICSLSFLTMISSLFTSIIIILAKMSPTPFLHHSFYGSVLMVCISVGSSAIHSYLRTVFATVLQEAAKDSESQLFWCGVFTQIGSFLGSFTMFPLVNVFHIFQSAESCPS